MASRETTVYVLYCYEDQEVKDVFGSLKEAQEWVVENRSDREDMVKITPYTIKGII
jgi:hypothetical protein